MSMYDVANIMRAQVGKAVSASFEKADATTAYDAKDVVGPAVTGVLTFAGVSSDPSGNFLITGVRMRVDVAAVPAGMSSFRLHLYNAAPTAIADNTAFDLPAGDRAKYLGYITISAPIDLGATLWAQDDNVNFSGKLAAGSTSIYGMLETVAGYTPTAKTVKTITLNVMGV